MSVSADEDLFMGGEFRTFVRIEQLLMHFFSPLQTGEDDIDVPPFYQTAQPDKIMREINNPYRLPHVQDIGLSA